MGETREIDRSCSYGAEIDWPSRELRLEDLDPAPAKQDDIRSEVQDDVIEVNLGTEAEPRPTYLSKNLSSEATVNLLQEYKDSFAWES